MVNTEILCKATLLYNRNIEVMEFYKMVLKEKSRKLVMQYTNKPQYVYLLCMSCLSMVSVGVACKFGRE